jgi:tetratricopeptide (TPR) repeat protein
MKKRLPFLIIVILLAAFSLGNINYLKDSIPQKYQNEWSRKSVELEEKEDWKGLLKHSLLWTEAQPKDDVAWFSLGNAFAECEKYDEAIKSYKHALDINSSYADTWYNLGLMYYEIEKYEEAIDSLRQAVNINEGFLAAWANLGIIYYQLGHTNQVKEVYEVLKNLDSSIAEEFYNLFMLH